MAVRILPHLFLLSALVACSAAEDDGDRPASIDSAIAAFQAESAPPLPTKPPVFQPMAVGNDTLVARESYLCLPDLPVFAVYWVGESARVVLRVNDSLIALPQVTAPSGSRYRLDAPLTEWWSKGDSATFAFDQSRLACGINNDVEF